MSYIWIVRLSILMLAQLITSFFFIYKGKKKISYFTEILLSIISILYVYIVIPVIKQNNIFVIEYIYKEHNITTDKLIYYIVEYVILKITLLVIIAVLKYISFYSLISISKRNGIIAKIGYKIFGKTRFIGFMSKMWNKVDYGIRIKKGIPSKVRRKHRKTGVLFDKDGFPIFEYIEIIKLERRFYNKTRETHFYQCNKKLYERIKQDRKLAKKFTKEDISQFKEGETPSKYTWHHHQKKGIMQLVDRKIHESVKHRGGFSIWGKRE